MKGVHKMGLAGSGPENWTYVQLFANLSCNVHVGLVLVLGCVLVLHYFNTTK